MERVHDGSHVRQNVISRLEYQEIKFIVRDPEIHDFLHTVIDDLRRSDVIMSSDKIYFNVSKSQYYVYVKMTRECDKILKSHGFMYMADNIHVTTYDGKAIMLISENITTYNYHNHECRDDIWRYNLHTLNAIKRCNCRHPAILHKFIFWKNKKRTKTLARHWRYKYGSYQYKLLLSKYGSHNGVL
ncbi:ORF98 protein [Operophtera brumata nucleopolyhedrovirus]|uniref:ORF98 protein n=1 Tax=Operophtera brumata nucleopolyhedrovirus TaxID=1046267 RepID=A0A2H4UZY3_9ABAC|nr:ORF98 protein [Operophtera brumata nucleopolyhedrovirus]AUA60329.1 ORF98 protein [Operophtera brumata nucleopolyhedrovirus]